MDQTLRTEPSFSIYSSDDKFRDEAENEDLIREKLEKSATAIGESSEAQFSFAPNSMRVIEEDEDLGESGPSNSDHDGDLDSYYSKLVRQKPSDPLVLRNYAQYLESKGDFTGAEEYYYRATLADPNDGEILSQYAELVWEIHGDEAKASDYFERALHAAPENSNVLAAYASFIWRIDENAEEEESLSNTQADENSVKVDFSSTDFKEEKRPSSPPLHLAMGLGIDAAGFDGPNIDYISSSSNESNNVEEYYKRMVEENPRNSSSLRNYALFLHQSKGDLNGAEEYYSRAILVDPNDGQVLSLYASILWQLHGNRDRAVEYFERAVLATPEDSDVLAAYAKFLWETEAEAEAEEVDAQVF